MYALILLTIVWVVLSGGISLFSVASGLVVGVVSLFFVRRFIGPKKIKNVSFVKLIFYPIFLIGQVYLAGFMVIKMIILGCRTDVVKVDTALENEFLRTILCNSITLIPGSVMLEQEESKLTVMLLRMEDAPAIMSDVGYDMGYEVKGKPEALLLKAQK